MSPAPNIECLRILPTELKPRLKLRRSGWWALTVPPWACLRGFADRLISRSTDNLLSCWAREIEQQHGERFEVLVYRARREHRQMLDMQLHTGRV